MALADNEAIFAPPQMAIIVDESGRLANLRACRARHLSQFFDLPTDIKTAPIAIIGGGPSLRKTLHQVAKFPGPIMTCGSAHDYLRRHHIVPDYSVNLDPDARMPDYFHHMHPHTRFLLASTSAPELFDHLANYQVFAWNAAGEASPEAFGEEKSAVGGSTVATRAWVLAHILGYREFVFFGVDSSFPKFDDQHADELNTDSYNHYFQVRVMGSDAVYLTSAQLAKQSQEFMRFLAVFVEQPGVSVTVKGDSLTREYWRVFMRERSAHLAQRMVGAAA